MAPNGNALELADMLTTGLSRWVAGVLLSLCPFVFVLPAAAQSLEGERRIALVVGNFSYVHVPRLANPGNDATLIATALRQLGFTLVGGGPHDNVDKTHFDGLVQEFGRAIQGADVALFYYAGHGMQVDGNNWLVPTDANPTRPQDLEFQMIRADLVLKQMDAAGTRLNIVILDACRNNPFNELGSRAVQGGLAQMRAPEGTLISFATQPGSLAADGHGVNGPYALALAGSMGQPGLDIFHVFNRVGLTVKHDTDGAQLPWVSSSPIDGDFYFKQTDAVPDVFVTTAIDTPPAAQVDQHGETRTAAPATATGSANTGPAAPVGVPADHEPANPLATLRGLAEQGRADAQTDLGLAYAKGRGVPRDDAAALHWFQLAAAQGAARAEYLTGAMLERGRGAPRSYTAALEWYRRAAILAYPPAEVAMGRFYGRGLGVERDPKQRTDWYRRAADHGNPIGQYMLGHFYQVGDNVDKDAGLARQWYERAATQGFVFAEVRLALLYERGISVRQDYVEALRWFHKAADAGDPAALNAVGVFYRRGLGVSQDYTKAMVLFRQAADKGNPMAQFNIGLLYADGLGVKMDKAVARQWFEKAAAAGNEPAIARLVRIEAVAHKPYIGK
jgi:TPR repeat protein